MSSFGEELKRERELREISLREVAEATKISLRYLEALEANQFGELPGGVFNRGFVRAYSQYIGIDPETMVTSYLMEEQTLHGTSATADDAEVLRRSGSFGATRATELAGLTPEQLRWGLAALIAIVLIVGGLLLWSWLGSDGEDANTTNAEPVGKGALAPAPLGPTQGADDRIDAAERKSGTKATAPDTTETDPPATPPAPASHAAGLATASPQSPSATEPPPSSTAEVEPAATSVLHTETGTDAPPPAPQVARDGVQTRIRIVRATTGRVNCDDTRIEMLAGVRAGTTVEFLCKRFLVIDTPDAGAIELGLGSRRVAPLGRDGERLSAHRIDLARLAARGDSP